MQAILVVEDDKLLGPAIEEVLTEHGYSVTLVRDGMAAMKALDEAHYSLMYLDIMIEGEINGYEVLRRVKLPDSAHRLLPVVMLSNFGQMNEIDRAMELGAMDYLVKANIDLEKVVEFAKHSFGGGLDTNAA